MGLFERIYKTDLTDRNLMAFWHMARDAGRDASFAYCLPQMDDAGFVRWMRRPDIHPWLVHAAGIPIGLFLLTDVQGKTAQVHFCVLPCMSHRITIQDGRASLAERGNTVRQEGQAGPSETKENASSSPADNFGPASALFDPYNTRRGLWLEGEYRKGLQHAGSGNAEEPEEEELQPSLTHEGAEAYYPPAKRRTNLPVPVAAGLFCLGQALWEKDAAGQYRLDHLIGITPASNHAAVHFAGRLGGEYCGTVPGFCWFERERANADAVIRHFSRNAIPEFWKTL